MLAKLSVRLGELSVRLGELSVRLGELSVRLGELSVVLMLMYGGQADWLRESKPMAHVCKPTVG